MLQWQHTMSFSPYIGHYIYRESQFHKYLDIGDIIVISAVWHGIPYAEIK